jgi:Flp pilus assembly protein TadG
MSGTPGQGSAHPKKRRFARCLGRFSDDRGIAAVEFALILPLMLAIYLSTAITTKAYMASRKVALVARALADITSRQGACGAGNPCVTNTDMTNFFAAAATIMAPYSTTSLKMTISRIDVVSDSAGKLWAFTKWSMTKGGTARPCNGGNTAFTPPGTPALTDSSHRPLLAADVSPKTSGFESNLKPGYTVSGAPTGYLLVADVSYTYTPGFSFSVFNWTKLTTLNTGWSQGFWSRTGLPIVGTALTTAAPLTAILCAMNNPSQT